MYLTTDELLDDDGNTIVDDDKGDEPTLPGESDYEVITLDTSSTETYE